MSITRHLQFNSQINIARSKVCGGNLTTQMLSNNFFETVESFLLKDEAYQFMGNVKGTPACWKRFLGEVLSMAKLLGLPTFSMTVSCADLRWDELIYVTVTLRGKTLTNEKVHKMVVHMFILFGGLMMSQF